MSKSTLCRSHSPASKYKSTGLWTRLESKCVCMQCNLNVCACVHAEDMCVHVCMLYSPASKFISPDCGLDSSPGVCACVHAQRYMCACSTYIWTEAAESGSSRKWKQQKVEAAESGSSGIWKQQGVEAATVQKWKVEFSLSMSYHWWGVPRDLLGVPKDLDSRVPDDIPLTSCQRMMSV